ncbi:hypothetical protein ONE63_011217 [Megalurothrips usitatus]|uniref:Uncharacterized protein n=1 Tax=Megalurothrips usitatus TaxID=439358 RepID=A0AAV7X3N9_9NEOP|nr:hypothetical protein ONE63_011217 [Megalurothrips usitatus]
MRTHEETIDFAKQALESRKADKNASVFGVKGPSLLSKIVPDIIKCTAIDIMHGVFLGVFKMLLNLWLSPSFSGMPWSVSHLFAVLDEKLCKIKSPSFAERSPRTLKQFMLYYSVPLLKNVLEEAYLKHHCLLVAAISLLSQDSISLGQIQTASALLASYVSEFARLYPLRYLGLNVHQLVHLADVTLELGPCWVYSCFFLENFNGVINKMFHGTQHVALQICSSVAMMMKIPEFKSILPPESKVKEFCLRLEQGSKQLKIADVIDVNTNAVGKYCYEREKLCNSAQVVRRVCRKVSGTCCVFYRIQKRGVVYFAEEYPRQSSRKESSFITFRENETIKVGRILRFVRWSNCRDLCDTDCRNCPADYVAIIRIFERKHWFIHDMRDIRIPHISHVQQTDIITVVGVESILGLCFHFEADNLQYVAAPVNRLERE